MDFRYPDDPIRVPHDQLQEMEDLLPGQWIAQPKGDGWRRPGYFENGQWVFYSKRNEEASKLPPEDLLGELAGMTWPEGTAIDMEWMGPRCVEEMRKRHYGLNLLPVPYQGKTYDPTPGHELWIFDLLYADGKWQGRQPADERIAKLEKIFKQASAGSPGHPRIILVQSRREKLADFFQEQTKDPLSEGLVLRQAQSKLIGSARNPAKNKGMLKAKYRDIKTATF